jgi:hypothetical protein
VGGFDAVFPDFFTSPVTTNSNAITQLNILIQLRTFKLKKEITIFPRTQISVRTWIQGSGILVGPTQSKQATIKSGGHVSSARVGGRDKRNEEEGEEDEESDDGARVGSNLKSNTKHAGRGGGVASPKNGKSAAPLRSGFLQRGLARAGTEDRDDFSD